MQRVVAPLEIRQRQSVLGNRIAQTRARQKSNVMARLCEAPAYKKANGAGAGDPDAQGVRHPDTSA